MSFLAMVQFYCERDFTFVTFGRKSGLYYTSFSVMVKFVKKETLCCLFLLKSGKYYMGFTVMDQFVMKETLCCSFRT